MRSRVLVLVLLGPKVCLQTETKALNILFGAGPTQALTLTRLQTDTCANRGTHVAQKVGNFCQPASESWRKVSQDAAKSNWECYFYSGLPFPIRRILTSISQVKKTIKQP